ncbi:MAG: methionyl-tRNA formyltransferase [Actinomycetota bacterium]|jgi:methionyl-tRNA formyltransferase|nr:methionyl-tRNA formyltransferase [Actinomycetota bacterium]
MKLTPTPVKVAAQGLGLEIIQDKARSESLHDRLVELEPDVAVVVAYGSILPASLLEVPAKGFVNLHFSLLPAYRGAAPVQRAIMNGEKVSGASIMVLTEGMDEGPVLARFELPILTEDSTATYGAKLADIGAELLVDVVPDYVDGRSTPVEQDHATATYAPKLTTDDARIDWSLSSSEIHDQVRACDPEPGAWTTFQGVRLKVFRTTLAGTSRLTPGELDVHDGTLMVGTGVGILRLDEVQPATKKKMAGTDFARGLHLTGDERMGE